jgi:sugar phosphate isomerase/epimerase
MLKLGTYEAWFDGEVIVPGETLEERLANLEEWGYQGIQLHRRTAELGVPALKNALAGSSVQLCIYGGGNGLLSADEQTRQAAVTQIKEGLHQAAELGAIGSIVVPVRVPEIPPPEPPKTLYELQCEILIEELSEIAPTAEATGTMVLLEPLNRYESRFLQQLEQAAQICRAVDSPGIKFMADFFHMNIEEIDIGQAITETADTLGYVHLADSNRYQPGAGHLDFRPGLAALKKIGYNGFMTLECRIMGQNKGQALLKSAQYIRDLWEIT